MSTDVLGESWRWYPETLDRFIEDKSSPLGMDDTFFMIPAEKRSRLVAAYVPRVAPYGS